MTQKYMSGSEYSASLSAALNGYWQTLEVRWTKDTGKTLYGGTSAISGSRTPSVAGPAGVLASPADMPSRGMGDERWHTGEQARLM